MAYNRINYLHKVADVQRLTNERYEIGRQNRCYRWVWRNYVYPFHHIGYRAYLRLLGMNVTKELAKEQQRINGTEKVSQCGYLFDINEF